MALIHHMLLAIYYVIIFHAVGCDIYGVHNIVKYLFLDGSDEARLLNALFFNTTHQFKVRPVKYASDTVKIDMRYSIIQLNDLVSNSIIKVLIGLFRTKSALCVEHRYYAPYITKRMKTLRLAVL